MSALAVDDADLDRLSAEGLPGVQAMPVDVTDRAAVTETVERSGPVDLLVTCAGVVLPGYFTGLPAEEFEREMQINYFGTLWAMRAAAPSKVARGRGAMMAVSSFAGLTELKPHGVHVGCVFPPDTDPPMLAAEVPRKPPEAQASGMLPVLSADDVAHAILRGAERRTARVVPGRRAAVLARAVRALPGVTDAVNDRDVAKHAPR